MPTQTKSAFKDCTRLFGGGRTPHPDCWLSKNRQRRLTRGERGSSTPFRAESAGCRRDGGAWVFLRKGQRLCRADSAALSLVTFEPDAHCGYLPLPIRNPPPLSTLQLGCWMCVSVLNRPRRGCWNQNVCLAGREKTVLFKCLIEHIWF